MRRSLWGYNGPNIDSDVAAQSDFVERLQLMAAFPTFFSYMILVD